MARPAYLKYFTLFPCLYLAASNAWQEVYLGAFRNFGRPVVPVDGAINGYRNTNIHVLLHGRVSFQQAIEQLANGFSFDVDRSLAIRCCPQGARKTNLHLC